MADKIANLYCDDNSNFTAERFEIWIKMFIIEFIKKWSKIDFHRMDKYIMLTQNILKKYIYVNFQNENFDKILNFFEIISNSIESGIYNFSFISIILKLISFFIDDIFKCDGEVDIKKKFIQGYFFELFEKLLKVGINI